MAKATIATEKVGQVPIQMENSIHVAKKEETLPKYSMCSVSMVLLPLYWQTHILILVPISCHV